MIRGDAGNTITKHGRKGHVCEIRSAFGHVASRDSIADLSGADVCTESPSPPPPFPDNDSHRVYPSLAKVPSHCESLEQRNLF